MAEASPSAILDSVLKQSRSPIFWNKSYMNLHIPLQELQSNLELIKEVLNEAELMAVMFPIFFRKWICVLQRVLYEADDLFDEASIRSMSGSGMVENVVSYLHNRLFGLTLAPKMKHINNTLSVIIDKCRRCNLIVAEEPHGSRLIPVPRKGILRYHPDYVRDDEFQMIGRKDDKNKVMKMLFDEDPSNFVVVIRGKAGVGKTTLCRAVYLDEYVKSHFEIRQWVDFGSVGGFSSINYWKKIITTLNLTENTNRDPEIKEEEHHLKDIFARFIAERKTLLVFDNIINNEDLPFIQSLKECMKASSHEGSRILVPQPQVYMTEETDGVHELTGVSKKHSQSIFERSAFGGKASVIQRNLMISLGKQILTRCRGNPAVLKGVGSLLYGKDDWKHTWEYFAHDFDFDNQIAIYNDISFVLLLYPNYHHHFGYLSLFKDVEFMYEDLMDQFAAYGFESDMARISINYDIFSSTHDWVGKRKCRISPKSKKIISWFAGVENTMLGSTSDFIPKFTRHVSISSSIVRRRNGMLPNSLLDDVIHRRTLLFFGVSFPTVISAQTLDLLFSHLQYLRVLSLQDLNLLNIPRSIGKLIHLKYLNLSGNNFRELPVSVCSLKNLCSLKLIQCSELKGFPGQITNFRELKHLEISMCFDLTYMPPAIAKLTTLQRLDRFVVSSRKGGLRYLKGLNNLNGNLSIELPRGWKDYMEDSVRANLEEKKGLTSLEFKWYGANLKGNVDQYVLEQLKPCPGIENLFVNNFGGINFPPWFTSLQRLTEITLSQCAYCSFLPPIGRLPELRRLTLVSMNLEYLEEENNYNTFTPFPSLKELRIGCMPNLKAWWSNVSILLSSPIEAVEIWRCPSLILTPPFYNIDQLILQDFHVKAIQLTGGTKMFSSIQGMVLPSSKLVVMFPRRLTINDCNQCQMLLTNDDEGKQAGGSLCEHLVIENCPTMEKLSTSLRCLTNLKFLRTSKCSEKLDCLYDDTEDGMPWKVLQALRRLTIEGFKVLTALPRALQQLTALEELEIKDCPRLKHLSSTLEHLIRLKQLTLSKCSEELDCLFVKADNQMPWKALQVLRRLTIEGFENLTALPRALQQLAALEELEIKDCPRLKHLSSTLEHLIMLENLKLSKCSEELDCLFIEADNGMPWKALQAMRRLTINSFENLMALPKSLLCLPRLFAFMINDCKHLKGEAKNLPKIQWLIVNSCPLFSSSIEEFKANQPDALVDVYE